MDDVNILSDALKVAARHGSADVAQAVLDAGGHPNPFAPGRTPLMEAAWEGYSRVVEILLDAGANLEARNVYGETPLMLAVRGASFFPRAGSNHGEAVSLLLARGANKTVQNGALRTAFEIALEEYEPDLGVLSALIEAGVSAEEIDTLDENGQTSLMHFAQSGQVERGKLLLEAGADLDVTDGFGSTALAYAAKGSKPEFVQMLLDAGADIHAVSSRGRTALMEAAGYARVQHIELFLKAGADVNSKDKHGRTALMEAAGHRDGDESTAVLVAAGADVHTSDQRGRTALSEAEESGCRQKAQRLLHAGARAR